MSSHDGGKDMLTVFICGASVAGCTAAILLREQGHRVILADKRKHPSDYKKLCTHFLQPSAMPVVQRMGLRERLLQVGGLPTKAALLTPAGWIDRPGPYAVPGGEGDYAVNIEREVLDPLLRERAREMGVELWLGTRCVDLRRDKEVPAHWARRWWVRTDGSSLRELGVDLLVAADGRASATAHMLGNDEVRHDNERSTYFAYYNVQGVDFDRTRSIFANHGRDMAFLYPLSRDRALLSLYLTKPHAQAWRGEDDLDARLIAFCSEIEGFPLLAGAQRLSPIYGYGDYPNLMRSPVWGDCAFVGDAALSLDPMSGVGCAFAMQSAAMLADAVAQALTGGGDVVSALSRYQALHEGYFLPHARGILADSRASRSTESLKLVYQTILKSARLQDDYLSLTGRVLDPQAFQRAFMRQAVATH